MAVLSIPPKQMPPNRTIEGWSMGKLTATAVQQAKGQAKPVKMPDGGNYSGSE